MVVMFHWANFQKILFSIKLKIVLGTASFTQVMLTAKLRLPHSTVAITLLRSKSYGYTMRLFNSFIMH